MSTLAQVGAGINRGQAHLLYRARHRFLVDREVFPMQLRQ